MAKKYTRKELKQPDEFLTLSTKVWKWASDNRNAVITISIAVFVVFAGVLFFKSQLERSAQSATSALLKGLKVEEAPIIKDAKDKTADELSYASEKEKAEASIKAFTTVSKEHGGGVKNAALLMRANVHLKQGDYPKAIKDFQTFLSQMGASQPVLHKTALEGLSFAYEGKKEWDNALKTIEKLDQKGQARFNSLFHKARITLKKGNKTEAKKLYQEISTQAESMRLKEQAKQQLAILDK